jgi:hypothetical protein
MLKFVLILLLFSPFAHAQENKAPLPLSKVEKCAGKVATETREVLELLKKLIKKKKQEKRGK